MAVEGAGARAVGCAAVRTVEGTRFPSIVTVDVGGDGGGEGSASGAVEAGSVGSAEP